MNKIKAVFAFGGPYLLRYWKRLLIGILLGVMFGAVNASFVWATKTTFERIAPQSIHGEGKSPVLGMNPLGGLSSETSKDQDSLTARIKARLASVKQEVDKVVDPFLPKAGRKLDVWQIMGGLLLLPILIGLRGTVGYASTYCLSWASERAVNDLRVDVLAKLNTLSLEFFHRSKMGDLLTRINGDTSALQRALSLGFSDLIKEPITIICVATALLVVSPKLTLFAIVFLPFCVIPMAVLGKKVRKASGRTREASANQMSLLVEAVSGIRVIKAFSLEHKQESRFRDTCNQMVRHNMKTIQARGLVNPIIEVIAMMGLSVLLLYIIFSRTELDDLVAFLTGVIMLFEPIKKLGSVHVLMEQTSIGVGRLMQLLAEQTTVKEAAAPKPLTQFKDGITFENVTFSYGAGLALEKVNLTVPRGFKLGIAGESGSGKSTLVNLLLRFYDPTQGAVKIDGVDIRDISFNDLRRSIALVSQEIVIFDQTIADNIGCGKENATREEVIAAAKAAFAHDFIMQLPQGYDTLVGERGQSLSGGQRQRLAIARAFIRNAPILVLDEATASLDSHAEQEVQAAIDRLEQNKTVICVAHRLSTLADMDKVVVLSKGHIVEEGGFKDLIKAKGLFATMAQRQGLGA